MELMFSNAKEYNEDDSALYQDAVLLEEELHRAADIERAKTDEELTGAGEEGVGHNKNLRIPLDKIEHKGETYRVGKYYRMLKLRFGSNSSIRRLGSHCQSERSQQTYGGSSFSNLEGS